MEFHHVTVLRDEAAALLRGHPGMTLLDCTLGGGGHSEALLAAGARVVGIDRDPRAVAAAAQRLSRFGEQFCAVNAAFSRAREILDELGVGAVDGVLLDLGVSSPQFDDPARGFSFSLSGPLDMRMGADGETARELIGRLSEQALADVLYAFGEERDSRRIARAVKSLPEPPATTGQLADIVAAAIPRCRWPKRIHPATRTFQALRIAVNHELDELDALLEAIPSLLAVGGRIGIISFHSLEDRRVKERFRTLEGRCTCPPGLPVCACGFRSDYRIVTPRPVEPSAAETEANPRARSARLRGLERLR